MQRALGLALTMFFCSAAFGQSLTYADLKAKNGVQVGGDDLKQLLPGAKVISAEEWCRVMFKVDNRYFGVGRLEDSAPASEFEISRQ